MNIAAFDACIGRGVAAIRAKQYQPWINHFISSKTDEIHDLGTGATFPNISTAALANVPSSVPPLAEQQRIVGILDEAFEGIATAKANASQPNMGLTSWRAGTVRKGDVTVAKNYLTETEIDELNRIVVMFLDYADDQARRRKQVFLSDWTTKLATVEAKAWDQELTEGVG